MNKTEHYRITVDVTTEFEGVNRCGDIEHKLYMIENELLPYTVKTKKVEYKVEKLAPKEIFPELRESEDERIRTEIIGYLNSKVATAEETELLYLMRWIAYLEKQKENPKSADSIPSDRVSDVKCENRWQKTADFIPEGMKGPSGDPAPSGKGLSDFLQGILDAVERIYNLDRKDWDVVCNLKHILLSMLVITTSLGYEDLHGETAKLLDQIIK